MTAGRDLRLGIVLTADGKDFRGEIRASEKDLDRLRGQYDRGERASRRYGRAQKRAAAETRAAGRSFLEAHGHHVRYIASLAGGYQLLQFARSSNQAGIASEQAAQRFAAAADTSAAAAAEFAFFRAEAERLKLDIESLQGPYSGFLVALKGTVLEGQPARDIFTGIATAARVLSLSTDDLRGVFLALEQMVSKGTVSAEELRGQLGERLPGAMRLAARAMGKTEEALDDMLRKGELAATDLLPAFAAEARRAFGGDLEGALTNNVAALDEFNNEMYKLREAVAAAGLLDFEAGLKSGAVPAIRVLAEHAETAADALAALALGGGAALATWAVRASAGALAARGASFAALTLAANLQYTAAAYGQASAGARIAAGSMGVAAAATRGLLAALGPAGIALTAVSAGTFLLRRSAAEARPQIAALAGDLDQYREALGRLGHADLLRERDALREEIEAEAEEARRIQDLLARGAGPGRFAAPFGPEEIERQQARLLDALEHMRAAGVRYHEVAREIAGEPPPEPSDPQGSTVGLSASARAYIDSLLPEAEHVRRRLAELRAERERLAPDIGPSNAAAGVIDELDRAIAATRERLAELESSADDADAGLFERIRERLRERIDGAEQTLVARFEAERAVIESAGGDNADLLVALEEELQADLGRLRADAARDAADAEAARAARVRASGVPALRELIESNAALAAITDYSREALDRHNRVSERRAEIDHAYPDAADGVIAELLRQTEVEHELTQILGHKIDLVERFNPVLRDQTLELRAAREALADGAISAEQFAARLAELRIEAGRGGFEDGMIAELQRQLEAIRNPAANVGQSLVEQFGPDGAVVRGFADSASAALVAGESFREAFGNVARRAVQQLIADLIRAAIQALIVRAIAAAFTGGSSAALPGINSAALSGGTKLGSAGAGFTLPGFAAGGVFEDAAFRAGGVVDKPTYFGFGRERRIGLAGEAGPEAILPLERGPDGGLGVRAGGAGRPIQVHVHVNAADAADFDTLLLRRRRMISEMVADAMAQDGGR